MSKRLTYEFVKEQFEKEGYELLIDHYEDNNQKLDYICPKGHEYGIRWSNWQQGQRCPICSKKKGDVKKRTSLEFIKAQFEREDYDLLTTEYKNNTQKLGYICPKGHKHSITWKHWQRDQRCPYCAGNGRPTIGFVKLEFAKDGYYLLTKIYRNAYQKLSYICPKGHQHSITWNMWQQGQRCPYCTITASKGEIEVRNFVESLSIKVLANDRNQVFNPDTNRKFELDIFMPTINKAIEYNGNYWHKNRKEDLIKQRLCELRGIDLLIIWENEWKIQNCVCKSKIANFVFN